jgi:hypothetical protein
VLFEHADSIQNFRLFDSAFFVPISHFLDPRLEDLAIQILHFKIAIFIPCHLFTLLVVLIHLNILDASQSIGRDGAALAQYQRLMLFSDLESKGNINMKPTQRR